MKAILSDIDGNFEALQAVLADIEQHEVEAVYCLGDTVGYGPNPRECLDVAMHWDVVLLGHTDFTVMVEPSNLGASASVESQSLVRSWRELNQPIPDHQSVERRWRFLAERPRVHREGILQFVHGSPRNPLEEYIFPEDVYNCRKIERIFASVDRYCFNGHTHIPGIFEEGKGFSSPKELDRVHRLTDHKAIVNVGSVGQPRDGDWRACYVLLDGKTVQFRRVEYDVEGTIRKL